MNALLPVFPDPTLTTEDHACRAASLSALAAICNDEQTKAYILSLAWAHARFSEGDAA